jgi:hypothetical protein
MLQHIVLRLPCLSVEEQSLYENLQDMVYTHINPFFYLWFIIRVYWNELNRYNKLTFHSFIGKNSSGWCSFIEGDFSLYTSGGLLVLIVVISLLTIVYSEHKATTFNKS